MNSAVLRFSAPQFCVCFFLNTILAVTASAAEWQPQPVRQLNGTAAASVLPAKLQIVTKSWNRVVAVPYLAHMPEKDRLLMLVGCDYPHQAMVLSSDDHGTTWTEPRYLHVDAKGKSDAAFSVGLTYLGKGRLMANSGATHWVSNDYGNTWAAITNPPASNGRPWIEWDPLLVDRNPTTGHVDRLMSFCSDNLQPNGHFQGYIRFSTDGGSTWVNEIKVPEMARVNEVAFIRAKNGHIIAACRTDNPEKYAKEIDHYGGLAVSISKDNGQTWSALNTLYEWGRHHPSMVLMPNGQIVMTYVVRKGYPDTPEGFPQFGVEAVVSHDNGATWDLEHRYILDEWVGNRPSSDPHSWWPSSQATSSVLFSDGSILTAFGTGYRSKKVNGQSAPRDVGLILWRPEQTPR